MSPWQPKHCPARARPLRKPGGWWPVEIRAQDIREGGGGQTPEGGLTCGGDVGAAWGGRPCAKAAWAGGAGLPTVLEHLLGEGALLVWGAGGEWSEGALALPAGGPSGWGRMEEGLSPKGPCSPRGSWRARLSFSRSSMIQLSSSGKLEAEDEGVRAQRVGSPSFPSLGQPASLAG